MTDSDRIANLEKALIDLQGAFIQLQARVALLAVPVDKYDRAPISPNVLKPWENPQRWVVTD